MNFQIAEYFSKVQVSAEFSVSIVFKILDFFLSSLLFNFRLFCNVNVWISGEDL